MALLLVCGDLARRWRLGQVFVIAVCNVYDLRMLQETAFATSEAKRKVDELVLAQGTHQS